MHFHSTVKRLLLPCALLLTFTLQAQLFSPKLFDAMKWRMIGPHRGGRTVGAVGVPQQPNVFYMGVNNGGVWKTTDYGRTWNPIFDDQPTGSIGDVAVAPSNPNVVYVASGEGLQRPDLSVGNGMYKSTDAGKTWSFLGLKDGQQIGGICIDPTNENRVFAAVLGHPYGPNTERGVYRTTDGGKSWDRVLYKDENTGAVQVTIDPKNPNIVYADLWAARQGPWENGQWQGPESGLYKSTDGGATWQKLTNGLPTIQQGLGRIGFCIAPSDPNRLYATVDATETGGVYRSDNAGQTWTRVSGDERLWGRGSDFAEVKAHPTNPDIVFIADVAAWKSTDGGKTWNDFRGAPGGDDYHRLWINPNNPDVLLLAGDQGAIVTVNGGQTFSSWYNQPTAQFYHVSTDNSFPYNVLGGQQESGSVGIASRGNDGEITFREWHPIGVEEYGYAAADPLDPTIIYGGKITRYDKRTGQVQNIAPEAVRSGKYRFVRTAPVLFSPIDPKTLYFAGNVLFKTQNGGHSWQVISPDLTRTSYPDIPESVGVYRTEAMKTMPARGVIYTIAPSHKDINTIWAGTDDGLIQVTRDGGKTWKNVTPPGVGSWSKVSLMDAGHFDANTAYAAVNRIRCDDMRPHIYRTHDGGKTWQEIVSGLPNDPINVVREDPIRKGLLFAGSETAVSVSFDDGAHWQSLRLNMPATSIRDLVIKDDDLVVGTHGRSFWILDNMTALRQLTPELAKTETILYKPQRAYRVRWNMNPDTPLPQEEPAGQNPPDGAIIDYYLNEAANSIVTLTITDATGKLVHQFRSDDKPYTVPDVNLPAYWIRPQQILSASAGAHRFMWNMHYTPLPIPPSYPIAATFGQTAPEPTSPWVMPGTYTVKLTVNGKIYTQPLIVTMDPRVKTPVSILKQQHDLSVVAYESRKQVIGWLTEAQTLTSRATTDEQKKVLATLQTSLDKLNRAFSSIFSILQDADSAPTTQVVAAANEAQVTLKKVAQQWASWKTNRQ
ncbi:WD40/YVTN/BNR-like repeat-containing protein [Spirosoma radiotolerans]|uniref:Glycoside hydrolase n=1 Tax=Spirosoma radiotolerans TaxID=1379870 RepID=A0A0E3V6E4_9BACT|nr:glycoside hydrolase [Spirosoma radiotolerans]AKD54957.1 glycoside hydrolase [Spirosoma radiotolerans]